VTAVLFRAKSLFAGSRTAELFTDEAIAQIHQAARGKPAPSTTSAPPP
jgi:hypothetical protein